MASHTTTNILAVSLTLKMGRGMHTGVTKCWKSRTYIAALRKGAAGLVRKEVEDAQTGKNCKIVLFCFCNKRTDVLQEALSSRSRKWGWRLQEQRQAHRFTFDHRTRFARLPQMLSGNRTERIMVFGTHPLSKAAYDVVIRWSAGCSNTETTCTTPRMLCSQMKDDVGQSVACCRES